MVLRQNDYRIGPRSKIEPWQRQPLIGQWPSYNIESDQARGLAAWWPANSSYESAKLLDQAGRSLNGIFTGPVGWLPDSRFGGVLDLSDSNAYVTVSDNDALDTSDGRNRAVVFWVNVVSIPGSPDMPITKGTNNNLEVRIGDGTTSLYKVFGKIVDSTGQQGYNLSSSGLKNLNAGQWYHIVFQHEGSRLAVYVNSDFYASSTSTSANVYNRANDFIIGRRSDGFNSNAYYADIRLYNRFLGAAEIKDQHRNWQELYELPRRAWMLPTIVAITVPKISIKHPMKNPMLRR